MIPRIPLVVLVGLAIIVLVWGGWFERVLFFGGGLAFAFFMSGQEGLES